MNIKNNTLVLALTLVSLGCASSSSPQAHAESAQNAVEFQNHERANPQVPAPEKSSDWAADIKALGETLKKDGLIGLVHGANPERGLYVFEYNKPKDFFKRYYFSLLSKDPKVVQMLHRGDRIQVWGHLGGEKTPQPHLVAEKLQLIEAYDPKVQSPGGHDPKQAQLPDDLKKQNEMVVQVHAVVADGQVLVVEYKDAVVPVIVKAPDNEQTRDLFRGDVVRIGYDLKKRPNEPTHVVFRPRAQAPYFDMLQRLVDRHGKPISITGNLVLFPKSPVINQDIWAIEEDLGYGLFRYSTLVNFDQDPSGEMAEWAKLKAKFRTLWDAHKDGVGAGRNKFINRQVRITAKGIANVVSPAQANAQLFLKVEDVTILP